MEKDMGHEMETEVTLFKELKLHRHDTGIS